MHFWYILIDIRATYEEPSITFSNFLTKKKMFTYIIKFTTFDYQSTN